MFSCIVFFMRINSSHRGWPLSESSCFGHLTIRDVCNYLMCVFAFIEMRPRHQPVPTVDTVSKPAAVFLCSHFFHFCIWCNHEYDLLVTWTATTNTAIVDPLHQIKIKSNQYSFNWQNTTTDTYAKVVYIIPKLLDGRRTK